MAGTRGTTRSWWLLGGALLMALARPVATVAWTANAFSSTSETALLAMTNETRAAAGLPVLHLDPTLVLEARWRSRDMIERAYFSHAIPPDGHRYAHELSAMGYCFVRAGENIGWNAYPDETATRQIHEAFLASASHRMAILQPDWDAIGIGAYQGAGDQKMWTVLFAQRCPTEAARAVPATDPSATGAGAAGAGASAPIALPKPARDPGLIAVQTGSGRQDVAMAIMAGIRDLARLLVRLAVPVGAWRT